MSQIQFISISPEQLQTAIIEGVKTQLEDLKNNLEPKKPTEFMTRQNVADLLQVDLSTIWAYTKKGLLTSYGIGSRVFYKRVEVESAIVKLKK